MNELIIGFVFLGALLVFFALLIARRFGPLSLGLRIGHWVSGILVLVTGGYLWLFLHALTVVTVTSQCPDYAGIVSAGDRHSRLISIGQTDYFAFVDPFEGGISVEGKSRTLATQGYVTTFGIEHIDFRLDAACSVQADQVTLA